MSCDLEADSTETALGWRPYARGGVVSVKCPGDHYTMCTEPNVQFLCREYMAAMDHAIAAV